MNSTKKSAKGTTSKQHTAGKKSFKKNDSKYLWILGLSVIGFVFSILVYLQHLGNSVVNSVCNIVHAVSQCNIVASSPYATLFGIDNSIIGILGFAVLISLSIMQYQRPTSIFKNLILLGSIFSGILAIIFLYLQMFIIQAYCIYCVIVDIASIILLIIAINELKEKLWR